MTKIKFTENNDKYLPKFFFIINALIINCMKYDSAIW